MSKALFLDLDGTIIETKSGETFPIDINDWKFKKGILNKIKEYVDNNYKIIIVTNQAEIDEGYINPNSINSKIIRIIQEIETYCFCFYELKNMDRIIYYCSPSLKCPNRKPSPNFAFQAKKEYGLELEQCIMVGDASGLERKIYKLEKKVRGNGQVGNIVCDYLNSTLLVYDGTHWNHINTEISEEYPYKDKKGIYKYVIDHSDSDKMFAENAGMKYIDIEEFLKD